MKKKTIYILVAVIIVILVIIGLSSGSKKEQAQEETNYIPQEEEAQPEDVPMEEISPAKVNLIMEIGNKGFNPDRFKVTKGITFNWHLVNTEDGVSYGVKFDDPSFGDGAMLGVESGKGKENVRAFVVPSTPGEYTFYELSNPELKGAMYVVE